MRNTEPIAFFKVDVKSIIVPDSMGVMYSSEYLDQIADSIIKCGGELLTPLLVRQTGLEVYELLDCSQYLLLLAVKRAKELAPRTCEMVNVFVISADAEAEAQHQLNLVQGN